MLRTKNYSTILIVIIFLIWPGDQINAQARFEITEDIRLAYREIMNLQLDNAKIKIEAIKQNDEHNLLAYHIENYIDFFRIFIQEERGVLDSLEINKEYRINQIKKGDPSSPYYKFSQAEILLQWVLARSKFYDDARIIDFKLLSDLNLAYRLLEANMQEHPDFLANRKSLGLVHSLASYLPGVIKNIFSIKGSLELGKTEIESLVHETKHTDFLFKDEVNAIYAYMLLYLFNQPEKAWEALIQSELDVKSSPLACFIFATIALKTGRSQEAIRILEERPIGAEYLEFYYLDFLEGKNKLYRLDEESGVYISRFLSSFKGRHFVKDAFQKLAWYELVINQNIEGYKKYMMECKTKGRTLVEDDGQALFEAKSEEIPNDHLLRTRLLFDGGYFEEAKALIVKKSREILFHTEYQIEFYYRFGRIEQSLGNVDEAQKYFKLVMKREKDTRSFFAANSALQLGLIMEGHLDLQQANFYFDECLKFSPKFYKNQLHNKARAGKARIRQGIRFTK